MKQGQSLQQILNDIHSGKLQTVDTQRAQLIKRKDLHNICRDFNIGSSSKQLKNNIKPRDSLQEETQETENEQQDPFKVQEIFLVIQNADLQLTGNAESTGKQDDILENLFNNCGDIPAASCLKDNGSVTNIEEIHELPTSESILYFEEQNCETPTVIQIGNENQECSNYEEIGRDEGTVSDQEETIEADPDDFPIICHEDVSLGDDELENSSKCLPEKNKAPKTSVFDCYVCDMVFTRRKNLYAHMRNIHELIGERDPTASQKHVMTELCSICGKTLLNKRTLRKHRREIHKECLGSPHRPRIRCPVSKCNETFALYSQFREHLINCHQLKLIMEELHFISEKEFLAWKDRIQANTVSFYVLDSAKKVMKDGTEKMYYNCNRSHSYKRTGNNMRKLKSFGSNKIGRSCPSRIEAIVRNGQLDVKFWKTHLGHGMDIRHTTLSQAVRTEIAGLMRKGKSFEQILDIARNRKLKACQSQRVIIIKRKDLHNICRDFHISSPTLHSSDG